MAQIQLDLTISIGDLIAIVFGTLGLAGLFFAYVQLRMTRQSSADNAVSARAGFILEVNKLLHGNRENLEFFYRLDYDQRETSFRFDQEAFPNSNDELCLDRLLYLLAYVGSLLRRRIVDVDDLLWMRFVIRTVLGNQEVHKYLEWIQSKDQVPGHSGFLDAIYLYEKVVGGSGPEFANLQRYKTGARSPGG